jgi:hypothetical protein
MTKTTSSTVRILLSYDYCHFEISKQIEGEDIVQAEIDEARKDVQRLADKAVGQYKTAKEKAIKRTGSSYERMQLEKEVREINMKKEEYLTPDDKAKIKALSDYKHQCEYDYMDDDEYQIGNE